MIFKSIFAYRLSPLVVSMSVAANNVLFIIHKVTKINKIFLALFQKSVDFRQNTIFVILSVAKNPRIYGEMP